MPKQNMAGMSWPWAVTKKPQGWRELKQNRSKCPFMPLCGFFFAIATMVMISKSNTTASNFGPGTEFTCSDRCNCWRDQFYGWRRKYAWDWSQASLFWQSWAMGCSWLAGEPMPSTLCVDLILLGAVAFDEYQRMSRTTKKITGSSVEKTNA